MGDISTWNPVDNSNTTAPPDGWPEGMAPSAVNNSARAMMGAIRRWYDTVTTQLASLTTADNLRVLKAGDTMTGTLSAPQYNVGGGILATRSGDGHNLIYDAAGEVALSLGLTDTSYRTDQHSFQNNAGAVRATLDPSGNFTATGTIQAPQLTSTGSANITNAVTVGGLITGAAIQSIGDVHAGNAVTAPSMTATGTITAANFVGNVSVPANGPVSTGGTVTGGQVTSTGNASVAGTMTAGSVSASSDITAAGSVTGGSLHCMGTMQTDGQSNLSGPVVMGPGGAWARIDSGGTFNISGSWTAFSGREVKENMVPYDARGLDAVLALHPVSFTYRADLFGVEEAEKVRYGLVADEVAPVLPEMVGEATFGGRDLPTVNAGLLPLVLINACKELAAQNAALAARITALEGTHV